MVVSTSGDKVIDFAVAMAIARSVFSLCQRRVEKGRPLDLDHVDLGCVVANVLNSRDDFAVDDVRRGIELGINQYRSMLVQPASITLSSGLEMELRPADDDDRVLIVKRGLGNTVVSYDESGLSVDAYRDDRAVAVGSIRLGLGDLQVVPEQRR